MRNIVATRPTIRRASQQRYFDYMRAHNRYSIPVVRRRRSGGLDGGAPALRRQPLPAHRERSFNSALRSAVTNLRRTNLPVGITVAHGNHAWVLTGFTATADPGEDQPVHRHERPRGRAAVGPPEPRYGYDMRPDRRSPRAS